MEFLALLFGCKSRPRRTKKYPVRLSKLRQTSQAPFAASSFSSWFTLTAPTALTSIYEYSDLSPPRLIQGQVTRAEVEESTFAMKRELAAIRQHDTDTNEKLGEAKER